LGWIPADLAIFSISSYNFKAKSLVSQIIKTALGASNFYSKYSVYLNISYNEATATSLICSVSGHTFPPYYSNFFYLKVGILENPTL